MSCGPLENTSRFFTRGRRLSRSLRNWSNCHLEPSHRLQEWVIEVTFHCFTHETLSTLSFVRWLKMRWAVLGGGIVSVSAFETFVVRQKENKMPDVVPFLTYEDGIAALEWLAEVFGFTETARFTSSDGRLSHG